MKELKRFYYWIIHVIGCPESDMIEECHGSRKRCKKCGRFEYTWR